MLRTEEGLLPESDRLSPNAYRPVNAVAQTLAAVSRKTSPAKKEVSLLFISPPLVRSLTATENTMLGNFLRNTTSPAAPTRPAPAPRMASTPSASPSATRRGRAARKAPTGAAATPRLPATAENDGAAKTG